MDRNVARLAVAESARRGYLDGRSLAGVFAWLRPNDLIWNYWVSNYLLGRQPPAFDILYWNADTTRMPAALHRDFMRVSLGNQLVRPGETGPGCYLSKTYVPGASASGGSSSVPSDVGAGTSSPVRSASHAVQSSHHEPGFVVALASQASGSAGSSPLTR